MLQTIKIKNFALIENAEIPFAPGLNILSGETGAGKSIVLEAISLLLGGRANSEVIRSGADEAIVEGFFDTEELPWLKARMKEVGIDSESSELLIKRTIHRNGKNRIFINGELATLNMLQEVCEDLVDLCGQNEHQSLFKAGVQIDLLDRFSSLATASAKVRSEFLKTIALREEWESLKRKEEERVQRLEFIKFQVEELNEAALQPGEDETLATEKKLLQSHEQRLALAAQVDKALDGDDGALNGLKLAISKSKMLVHIDESVLELYSALERGLAEVEEATRLARHYVDQADLSPGRLEEVQSRLSLITNLRRKYGQTIDEIIAHHQKLASEIDLLENLSTRLEGLEENFQKEKGVVLKGARDLFAKRKKGADAFSKAVMKELKELRMADASVNVALEFQDDITTWGSDSLGTNINFEVQTNLGEEKKTIQKIVSGGELSRLMLAIRRVIADKGGIGVYLFDEIDAGLGGQTAFTVGKKLKSVAAYNQVICITHVPQVACFADHHLSIHKRTVKGRTVTEVDTLTLEGRREEIARMLGAEKLTPSAIKNAKDLMQTAREL
jgi:DNA repair protein RecN (Recombination protein N)